MNLTQAIYFIEEAAAAQPNVETIVRNDVFRLNSRNDVKYGVFAWLQGEHSTDSDSGLMDYSFTFFYVDRLRGDRANEIEIQSVGIETIENVIRRIEDSGLFSAGTYSFTTFNQRFHDDCAGVFCRVRLEAAKNSVCLNDYGDATYEWDEDNEVFVWEYDDRRINII